MNSNKHVLDGSDDCTGRDGAFDALPGGRVEIFDVSVAAIKPRITLGRRHYTIRMRNETERH